MATYSDNFTNTDGTDLSVHNANWTATGITIQSNQAAGTGSTRIARLTGIAFGDDQFAQAKIGTPLPSFTLIFLRVRDNGSSYFAAGLRNDRLIVYRGASALNTDTTISWAAGDTARIEVEGSTIRVYKNGVLVKTVTDTTTWSGTKTPGFVLASSSYFDDFLGGDLVAASLPAPGTPSASSITRTSATISFTDNSAGEDGFDAQVATAPFSSWSDVSGSPLSANATGFSLSGLTEGTDYRVRVRASSTDGLTDSDWVVSSTFRTLTRRLKITNGSPDAIGAVVSGVIFSAPGVGEVLGSEIGEFAGKTIVNADGVAALSVDCSEFGGSSLAPGDTPRVILVGTTKQSSIITASVADEV